MKTLLFALLIAAPALAHAQDPTTSNLTPKNKPQQYSCREIVVTSDGKTMTLKGEVEIETENLILRADSAVFNNENKTWLAYGTTEIIFKGQFKGEVDDEDDSHNTIRCNDDLIRYNLEDKTVYLE